MTFDEIDEAMCTFTYKPGYKLYVTHRKDDEFTIWVETSPLPDATRYPREDTISIRFHNTLPTHAMFTQADLLSAVRATIHECERHEADEWLRVNGKLASPPAHT